MQGATPNVPGNQRGVVLLEALIAILIFSIGILSLIGLQGTAIKLSGDAKYRSDASLLANQLIGQMWVSNRAPAALQTNFQGGAGTNGNGYNIWVNSVAQALPGVTGVAANQPLVTVTAIPPPAGASSTTSLVQVIIFWKAPNESGSSGAICGVVNASAAHCYVATAQII